MVSGGIFEQLLDESNGGGDDVRDSTKTANRVILRAILLLYSQRHYGSSHWGLSVAVRSLRKVRPGWR